MGSTPAMLGSWRGSGKTLGCRYTCSIRRLRLRNAVTGSLSEPVGLAARWWALTIHATQPCPASALQMCGPLHLWILLLMVRAPTCMQRKPGISGSTHLRAA